MRTVASTLVLLAAFGGGCASIGPKTVARDRFEYSASISESWKRQTLLNIVKMRYLDPPIFVDVGQIVAGYSLETGLTLGGSFPESAALGGTTGTVGGSARFTDRPTITYTPLTGNRFVKALMTPLPPEAVMYTVQSGWPADAMLAATVAVMNGLKNQEQSLGGATPADPGFQRALELLRGIQASGGLALRVQQNAQKQETMILVFQTEGVEDSVLAALRELRALLRLDPEATEIRLVFGARPVDGRELAVVTRSILHMPGSMAAMVEVPPADVAEGRAVPGFAVAAGAGPPSTRIASGPKPPPDAFVAVRYRDHWFWIDDRDLRSKRSFAFMMLLFTLADSGPREGMPVLTIPAQ